MKFNCPRYLLLFAFVLLQSLALYAQKPVNNKEIKKGESINFKTKPESKPGYYAAWYTRGAFDLTSYQVDIDTQGNIHASEIRGCYTKHQGEIVISHASGKISRNGDTMNVLANTIYSKFYVLEIKENGLVDSFTSIIEIDLVSQTLKGDYCPNIVSINSSSVLITALPRKVAIKEIWKPSHPDKTIGEFIYFSIKDSEGKFLLLPQSDYMIIGGNSLTNIK